MRSILLALALVVPLLTVATVAQADHYHNGYIHSGYTYNDGYWWKDGVAYTRHQTQTRYWNGCRYCYTQSWVYTKHHVKESNTPGYEGWRKDLTKMAADQLKWSFLLKQSEQEQKEYLEVVKAFGLTPYPVNTSYPSNLTGAEYGYNSPYSLQGSLYTYQAPLAAQGSTVYGYQALATNYPEVDLKVLYNQAYSLAQGAQELTSKATGDFSELIGQHDGNRAEIARILARGQAAAQVLEMLKDPAEAKHTRAEFEIKPDYRGGWKVEGATPKPTPTNEDEDGDIIVPGAEAVTEPVSWSEQDKQLTLAVLQAKCSNCHNSEVKKGNLDLTNFLAWDTAKKQQVVARVLTEDESLRMPRKADGGAGKPLSLGETGLLYRAAYANTK